MGRPITWQNVGSTASIGDATSALNSASRLFNTGFDGIGNVLKQAQATDEANWNQAKVNNTEAFYNAIASRYATPEAYQAAVASGDVAREMAQYGAQIDQSSARKFMDNQMATLQDRILKANTYQTSVDEYKAKPEAARLAILAAQDPNAALPAIAASGIPQAAALAEKAAASIRENAKFDLDKKERTQRLESGALDLKEKKLLDEEKDTSRVLDNLAAAAAESYRVARLDTDRKVGNIAKNLGYPVDKSGIVKYDDLTTEQLTRLQHAAVLEGVQDPLGTQTGDTVNADSFIAKLRKDGAFKPEVINRKEADLRKLFDSRSPGSVGVDAARENMAAARDKVGFSQVADDNWFTAGSTNARKGYEQLATEVPTLLDKTSGYDAHEDVADLQKLVFEMATKGIEVKKGVFISPPVQLVRNAIRTAQGGWFTDAQRANNAREILKGSLDGIDITQKLKDATEADAYFNKQKVKAEFKAK